MQPGVLKCNGHVWQSQPLSFGERPTELKVTSRLYIVLISMGGGQLS